MRAIAFLYLLGLAVATATLEEKFNWGNTGTEDSVKVCLVDPAACGCCLMQKQMTKMERFFNMSLDELKKNLQETNKSLNSVRAVRSAFSVALEGDFGPFSVATIVVYKYVFLNIGNDYNLLNGKFTVPRSGVYIFTVTIYSDAGGVGRSLEACARLMVNERQVAWAKEKNTRDQHDSTTVFLTLQVYAEDEVYIVLPPNCFLSDKVNGHFNTFTGFMLYATN